MLQTQIAWWNLQETKRHNITAEEQNRQDLDRRERELINTINYNAHQVEYWQGQLAELTRHNKATESLTAEEIQVKRIQATAQVNQARAALQQAQAALENVKVNQRNADIAAYNAKTNRATAKANIGVSKAQKQLIKGQTKTEAKRAKWYVPEHVAIPAVNAASNLVKSASTAYSAIKSSSGKKKSRSAILDALGKY